MLDVFYILAALQILLGIYSLIEGVRWFQMAARHMASHAGFYAPRVAVICPCKGLEPGLEENLRALGSFDYPNYEVYFALASAQDPAHEVLRRVQGKSKTSAHIVIAGPPEGCAEKVNNLRAAVEQLPEGFDVLVFADSDGRPGRRWLQQMVAPLANERWGAVTTFRWYFPDRGGFWSALGAAWNASIVSYLGDHQHNFCWGGGTAIRRKTFEEVHALEFWRGSVSDDYALTRALRSAGRQIYFAAECLVPTLHDVDFNGLVEFTNRQIIITRVYAPRLWALAGAAHLLYCITLLGGLFALLAAWIGGFTGMHVLLLALVAPALSAARGYLRLLAATELLPAWKEPLLRYGWAWTLLAPLVPFVYAVNSVAAAFTRQITWRGMRYALISPAQTRILSR